MLQPEDFLWLRVRQRQVNRGDAEPMDEPLLQDLQEGLEDLARFYINEDVGLQVAEDSAGYLTMLSGQWRIYVPWNLSKRFPQADTVRALFGMANRVSIAPAEAICVSGSSASLGSGLPIGDLDFSQYIEQAPAILVQRADAFRRPERERVLITCSYDKKANEVLAKAPWDQTWPLLVAAMKEFTEIDEAKRFKADFISQDPALGGALPASNVILSSDFSDRTKGAASESFVYQEAIALREAEGPAGPPWVLLDAPQIADYLDFLTDQIDDFIDENPVKALKRAFSFASMIGLGEFAQEAADILVSPESETYVARKRATDLRKLLGLAGVDEKAYIASNFENVPDKETETASSALEPDEEFAMRCRDFVERLYAAIRQIEVRLTQDRWQSV